MACNCKGNIKPSFWDIMRNQKAEVSKTKTKKRTKKEEPKKEEE